MIDNGPNCLHQRLGHRTHLQNATIFDLRFFPRDRTFDLLPATFDTRRKHDLSVSVIERMEIPRSFGFWSTALRMFP